MRWNVKRWTHPVTDVAVLSGALWVATFLRFEGPPADPLSQRLLLLWPSMVLLQYGALSLFGVPRCAWRYVGLPEVIRILSALAAAGASMLAVRLASAEIAGVVPVAEHLVIPIGVILIDFCLALLGIAGVRALRRVVFLRQAVRAHTVPPRDAAPALLIGAGEAGRAVAADLAHRAELGIKAVGFVDDDRFKTGLEIQGLKVLGTTSQLPEIVHETGASQALITIARATGRDIRRINEICRDLGMRVSVVPGLTEVVDGSVRLSSIREVDVEDLLGRDPVELEEDAIAGDLKGRVALVSGAGGSIGSELCRQIARFGPASLVLVERAEHALFEIHRELVERHPDLELIPALGDVCDAARVETIFAATRPEAVFHAAAHKHVPMMEENPSEAIRNNVGGTRIIAEAADRHGALVFTLISTDKAVNPSSVMGASKRVAELFVQALHGRGDTRFVTVRFGNVLGSAGSVIPIFKQQLARGGPLTITHPEMRRYFMTIPEASQLVLQAAAIGEGGEIFILDMGQPVKIADLARDMIKLSGLEPDEDIQIEYAGVRPGEKLFEELYVSGKNPVRTRHPRIFMGRGRPRDLSDVVSAIDELFATSAGRCPDAIRRALAALVPEYNPEVIAAPWIPANTPPHHQVA